MTNSSTILRQIFNDARPLVEQALALSEKFAGFRELATSNGLDWSQIKALLKAQVQDEQKDDGKNRVGKIIEKADFATAYADMLGLGSNMNEKNFSADPPHDEDGVLIEEPAARSGAAGEPATVGRGAVSAVALPPDLSEPSSVPSDDEAGQGGEISAPSVAPPTISEDSFLTKWERVINPAAGAAEQGSGAAPNTAPEPDLSSFAPMAGEDGATTTNGGDHEVATSDITNIDRIDFRSEAPDDMSRRASGAVPIPQSVPAVPLVVTDAPGSSPGPDPVETPGAIHSGEMPDLPAFLDRREKAA